MQSFWVRVKCPKAQKAGVYSGEVKVIARQDGQELSRRIPIRVRVNDFELPAASMLPLAITFSPGAAGTPEVRQRRLADTNGMFHAWRRKTNGMRDSARRGRSAGISVIVRSSGNRSRRQERSGYSIMPIFTDAMSSVRACSRIWR